jgi:hypothetical protein
MLKETRRKHIRDLKRTWIAIGMRILNLCGRDISYLTSICVRNAVTKKDKLTQATSGRGIVEAWRWNRMKANRLIRAELTAKEILAYLKDLTSISDEGFRVLERAIPAAFKAGYKRLEAHEGTVQNSWPIGLRAPVWLEADGHYQRGELIRYSAIEDQVPKPTASSKCLMVEPVNGRVLLIITGPGAGIWASINQMRRLWEVAFNKKASEKWRPTAHVKISKDPRSIPTCDSMSVRAASLIKQGVTHCSMATADMDVEFLPVPLGSKKHLAPMKSENGGKNGQQPWRKSIDVSSLANAEWTALSLEPPKAVERKEEPKQQELGLDLSTKMWDGDVPDDTDGFLKAIMKDSAFLDNMSLAVDMELDTKYMELQEKVLDTAAAHSKAVADLDEVVNQRKETLGNEASVRHALDVLHDRWGSVTMTQVFSATDDQKKADVLIKQLLDINKRIQEKTNGEG